MSKLKPGQDIYSYSGKHYEILKVGREWAYIKQDGREVRIEIETLKSEADYIGCREQFYSDLEALEGIKKKSKMIREVGDFFRSRILKPVDSKLLVIKTLKKSMSSLDLTVSNF